MALLALFEHVAFTLISGYLAFSGILTNGLIPLYGPNEHTPTHVAIADHTLGSGAGMKPSAKHSGYVYGGPIPHILIDNSNFQQAAVAAALKDASATPETSATATPRTLAERTEQAIVNIFCQYKTSTYIRTTTGSGFFVNKDGIVLTNAHVAQFLLLEDAKGIGETRCILRAGNPAVPLYEAELLYISPTWISQNASLITSEHPSGSGERDYALLYVTKGYRDTPLPHSFPYIPLDTSQLQKKLEGSTVLAAGYPAATLLTEGASAPLIPKAASTTLRELYTFGSNYADIFAIGDSDVAERGSSGGPVVAAQGDHQGAAIGLIVTKGPTGKNGAEELHALTLSYIDRTIKEETGYSLADNLKGDLPYRANVFRNALIPFLSNLLGENIISANNTPAAK